MKRLLILGAAGRDFFNYLTVYRDDPDAEVVAFTAQQIPHIAERSFPASLAGPRYPRGIPIHPEQRLEELVRSLKVDQCVLSYSDLADVDVMHLAARCNAAGADFVLLGAQHVLRSSRPVVAICASRTGAGKSPLSRAVVPWLREHGQRVAVIRHPMPYGDLEAQRVQRFASEADLLAHKVTVEEREEYEPHIATGSVVFAGVDYAAILHAAEQEADVILWDGGNNDTSFIRADLYMTVVDPHRAGHETSYYPGETNVRLADVVVVNKVDTAPAEAVAKVRENVKQLNPGARVVDAACPVKAADPAVLKGKKVLAIDDGPTLTHGGMAFGAAVLAAWDAGARELVDPRPFAVGEIAEALNKYQHVKRALPALGYGDKQVKDLEATIARAAEGGVEAVAIGTPIDLARLVRIPIPSTRVSYSIALKGVTLDQLLTPVLGAAAKAR
ncbi:MAG TPA: GTP-binding protein [Gemmatimonadales bacterium]|nr:GTP-binding protein [Gemmatimonadales bacterium]